MGKKTFCAHILPRMRAFTSKLIGPKDCVLVGVSGGADSVCLLHFLHYLSKEKHFALAAVHVNHSLRGQDSKADALFCKQFCQKLDIPFFLKKVSAKKVTKDLDLSPEHGARKARYDAFLQIAQTWGATKIALAHQLDDQAETILLNMLRGTKAKGLAGIPIRRKIDETIEIVRPLMCITRADVEAYLKLNGLTHVTDKTNEEEQFTRNWIRRTLLPMLEKKQPQIRQHLWEMAQDISQLVQK